MYPRNTDQVLVVDAGVSEKDFFDRTEGGWKKEGRGTHTEVR